MMCGVSCALGALSAVPSIKMSMPTASLIDVDDGILSERHDVEALKHGSTMCRTSVMPLESRHGAVGHGNISAHALLTASGALLANAGTPASYWIA